VLKHLRAIGDPILTKQAIRETPKIGTGRIASRGMPKKLSELVETVGGVVAKRLTVDLDPMLDKNVIL
jgi:hypothetical protein